MSNNSQKHLDAQLCHGDSLAELLFTETNSVDSVVTDPPYGLRFMGRHWDYDVPSVEIWSECLRVLKPGGYLLAFAGARTHHRMACRIEDAGFEIRDMIAWVYGQGFSKSRNIAERDLEGEAARRWEGWGTSLKPAIEPIIVARKPLIGTVAENVLAHGTGALNIGGCRVGRADGDRAEYGVDGDENLPSENAVCYGDRGRVAYTPHGDGRFPSNLIHDGSPEVVALFPDSKGSGGSVPNVKITGYGGGAVGTGESKYLGGERKKVDCGSGSAARFFKQVGQPDDDDLAAAALVYCAKPSRAERDRGLEGFEPRVNADWAQNAGKGAARGARPRANTHPTVKPVELMRYLCRLVTPPSGTVLDPFMGSGTTGRAAMLEGFRFIGMDREAEYVEIAQRRIVEAWERAHV